MANRLDTELLGLNMASSLQIQRVNEELNCPNCQNFFTDPVTLDCGHNFCRSCISRSWEKQETNRCAVCHETFPEKNLRVNQDMASLAEKARKFSLNPMAIKLHCEKHQEELKLFCESDKKLLCLVCRDAREHRDHSFLPIEEAVEIYKEEMKSSLDSLAQWKETALQAEAKQKQTISQLKEQASSLQIQVNDDFDKIHQSLTERQQRLMSDLRQRQEEILKRMETNLREIRSYLDSVHQETSELQTKMEKDGLIFLQQEAARKRSLENNDLGDGGPKHLYEALRSPASKIRILELGDNNLGDCGAKRLCEALRNLEDKTQCLGLGGNNLTSESTEDLVSDLSINHSLTELDMSNNQLRDYGVKRLSEALRNPECKIQRLRYYYEQDRRRPEFGI
ncbi:nuclear factor 7, brain-like [Callorhinchus milii]|uniref:nuclear factor 7, brain-like n=1 Tax=Callorhinchus milii TaxID=7868 RepID=UPI001C3FE205|nr:nuclear factor 7, brain-like [Callorhinchus milii]